MKSHLLPMLLAATALCGCSMFDTPPEGCEELRDTRQAAADSITLSFQMISSDVGAYSRADSYDSHTETDSEWQAFEDLIDLHDFAFYIFLEKETDANGNAINTAAYDPSSNPLVMRMTDIGGSTDPNTMVTGGYGAYTITMSIPRDVFHTVLGDEIDAHSTGNIHFRIVVLANVTEAGAIFSSDGTTQGVSYDLLAPKIPTVGSEEATTFGQFMQAAATIEYDLNSLHNTNEGDSEISGIYKGAIPMFGMNTFTTTEESLYTSRPEERINLGSISMLRSLAKVRVIDNAPRDKNADGTDAAYPRVAYAYVTSGSERAKVLPGNAAISTGADAYDDGNQVHTLNVAATAGGAVNRNFKLGYRATTLQHFGYLPEQALDNSAVNDPPVIVVVADLEEGRQEEYRIPMDGSSEEYPLLDFDPDHNAGDKRLLRNHIYTLQVDHIATGVPADITFTVAEWDKSEYTLDYTQTLTVSSRMSWDKESYASATSTDTAYEVTLKPWTDENTSPTPLEGTFNIESPQGYPWTAYLLDGEGPTGSFAFLDADGNQTASISGIIDKDPSTLRIVPKATSHTSERRSAQLQVVVSLPDGTFIEAEITPQNSDYKRYTIVQAPTL